MRPNRFIRALVACTLVAASGAAELAIAQSDSTDANFRYRMRREVCQKGEIEKGAMCIRPCAADRTLDASASPPQCRTRRAR